MKHRPALDGLRGLAVLAVMAFHTSPLAHGGFLGVDVFFVLSGYLITTLLLAEWDRDGRVDLRRFYLRRALRLGPAFLVMLLIATPLMLTVLAGSMTVPVWAAVGGSLLYVGNWVNVAVGDGTGPITHTWSLAIEEQFYLVWPVLLLAWLGRHRRPPVAALTAVIAVVAVGRWITWDLTHGDWMYYATTSHCDGLLLGALLAALLAEGRRVPASPWLAPASPWLAPASPWLALGGLAVLGSMLMRESIAGADTMQYGILLAGLGTVLVLQHLATADSGPLVRAFSFRPLAAVGKLSYGLYLYHFPVFRAVQQLQPGHYSHGVQHLLEFGITIPLTIASWFLVERPALRLKDRLGSGGGQGQGPGRGPGRGREYPQPAMPS